MPSMRAGLQPVYGFGWPVKEFPESRVRKTNPRPSDTQNIADLRKRIEAVRAKDNQRGVLIPTPTPPPTPTTKRVAQDRASIDFPNDDADNDADDEDAMDFDSEDERRVEANIQTNIARVAKWQEKMDAMNATCDVFKQDPA